jgi:hypothetical protein
MKPIIILICVVVIAIIGVILILRKLNSSSGGALKQQASENFRLAKSNDRLSATESNELVIQFEQLPMDAEVDESELMEIKEQRVIARIKNLVPNSLQAVDNIDSAVKYNEAVKVAGPMYQAIIPKGAVLDKSRAMEGAFRGSFRNIPDEIKGNANWVPADGTASNMAALNVANAAFGVASLVVGQYYMTQINSELDDISAGISKIADFQDNEYRGKVYALIAQVQKISFFKAETIENEELRKREISKLQDLEHGCIELLGQANSTLEGYAKNKSLEYEKYESQFKEADAWYEYQQMLIEILYKIEDLDYTLNIGTVSKEQSYALFPAYKKQTESTLLKLAEWHQTQCKSLGIDIEALRRKRKGLNGVLYKPLGWIKDDFNYHHMANKTAKMISKQTSGDIVEHNDSVDLFEKDVKLIAKGGRYYYLPETNYESKKKH